MKRVYQFKTIENGCTHYHRRGETLKVCNYALKTLWSVKKTSQSSIIFTHNELSIQSYQIRTKPGYMHAIQLKYEDGSWCTWLSYKTVYNMLSEFKKPIYVTLLIPT